MRLPGPFRLGRNIGAGALAFVACITECHAQRAQQPDFEPSFLSRVTIEAPVYMMHLPTDKGFNNHNWGAFINVDVGKSGAFGDGELSVLAGDFTNSYYKDTAILAGAVSWSATVANLKIDAGPVLGLDLNKGYERHNSLDPLRGAVQVRVSGTDFGQEYGRLNHLGVAVTLVPGTVTNLALTVKL